MDNNNKSSVVYQGKIPGRVKYSFAFGALGKDLIYGMIATFSMIYFTDIIKVAPAFIGTMFFVAKIWDAFNDLSWEWLLIIQEAVLANLYRGW